MKAFFFLCPLQHIIRARAFKHIYRILRSEQTGWSKVCLTQLVVHTHIYLCFSWRQNVAPDTGQMFLLCLHLSKTRDRIFMFSSSSQLLMKSRVPVLSLLILNPHSISQEVEEKAGDQGLNYFNAQSCYLNPQDNYPLVTASHRVPKQTCAESSDCLYCNSYLKT